MRFITFHRTLAVFLLLFVISHILIHLTALAGPEAHLTWLSAIQVIYRNPVVEPVLILALFSQVWIGLILVTRRLRNGEVKSAWGWLQVISGFYLAFFIIMHTGAALLTRHYFHLDTNFYWAAGSASIEPLAYGFRPYYVLAVLAVFTHLAAFVWFRWKARIAAIVLPVTGGVIAILIVAVLSGTFYQIDLPQDYIDYFKNYIELLP